MTCHAIFAKIITMNYKNFGTYLRFKRESIVPKMTLNKFAIDNGIEPAILSRIETQKQDTKLGVLSKIANGMGLTASELLQDYEKSDFAKDL